MPSDPFPLPLPDLSDDDLLAVEEEVQRAIRDRSVDHLRVFGLGEISVAIGWPKEEPRAVVKRLIFNPDRERTLADIEQTQAFIDEIERRGGNVLPTQVGGVERSDGMIVIFLVQPALPPEMLAETVLETEEPAVDHPLLVAVCDHVTTVVDERFGIDPQIPNYAWHDGKVWLFDVSSPMTFDADGKFNASFESGLQTVPGLLRPFAAKEVDNIMRYYSSPSGGLTQTAVFLKRIGADAWVDAAVETFNARLDEPIDRAVVDARYEANVKEFPRLKKLVLLQRAWQTKVRRKPYEFIVTDSFSGEVL